MDVREQRQQAENRDNLELQFLRFVGHPLRQRMESQVDVTDGENCGDQNDADQNH
ncbi:MAG: hypothetical protein J0H32_07005 [Rhizobiales bacterium]|nr:hypothetical protein [Hyphomicrobiales bacterium]